MLTSVYVDGQRIPLDPSKAIGKGGEADIYKIAGGKVLKLYKTPDHPDYAAQPIEQEGARQRIATAQRKLLVFPNNLPRGVIVPEKLATDNTGKLIVGFVMPLLKDTEVLMRYKERPFRQAGVPNEMMVSILKGFHPTISGVHKSPAVIGDNNDLNVLVRGVDSYLIDADSIQFNGFLCRAYTNRFVDPLLCDPNKSFLVLVKPYTENSDWYAFTIMVMQSLIFVEPYGGVYRPKKPANLIPHGERPLRRITIFHPEVIYPKPATHYGVLPDDLLQFFHQVFEKDWRGEFPLKLLEEIRWVKCSKCGTEHARSVCPVCAHVPEAAIKEVIRVRGQVTSTRIFRTSGVIVFATVQGGKLLFLYHENGKFKREDGSTVANADLEPHFRYRIKGKETLIAKSGLLLTFSPEYSEPQRSVVDSFGMLPIFDANERYYYWTEGGQLMRNGQLAPIFIGNVLSGQTLFWVGPTFGFGFYRAGALNIAFVFDAERPGINDSVKIPPIQGLLVDSICYFTKERCWFIVSTRQGAKIVNQCSIIRPEGTIEATESAEEGDGSWLGTLRGKCAVGNFLFVATDEGIVRVEVNKGKITTTKAFPDTEPFVDAGNYLFPSADGLCVVSQKEVNLLKIG